jgi:hypothetical protein
MPPEEESAGAGGRVPGVGADVLVVGAGDADAAAGARADGAPGALADAGGVVELAVAAVLGVVDTEAVGVVGAVLDDAAVADAVADGTATSGRE